ncbi:MAG: hypothetical protein WBX22_01535 [Silvibacterium sp.]
MTAVQIPGRISGEAVIHDLLDRIAAQLSGDCSLRSTDAYLGYSAKVSIELQLIDVDTTPVAATVNVGAIDPGQPSQKIVIGSDVTGSETEQSLEKPIDPDGVIEPVAAAAKTTTRYYTPRSTKPLPLSSRG